MPEFPIHPPPAPPVSSIRAAAKAGIRVLDVLGIGVPSHLLQDDHGALSIELLALCEIEGAPLLVEATYLSGSARFADTWVFLPDLSLPNSRWEAVKTVIRECAATAAILQTPVRGVEGVCARNLWISRYTYALAAPRSDARARARPGGFWDSRGQCWRFLKPTSGVPSPNTVHVPISG